MSIGMRELAQKLNLSVSTVSRVVNGSAKVRPETARLVMRGIEKYGYIPNEAARSLKTNHSTTIGIVVADLNNLFYTSIISGAETFLQQQGYSVILCNYDEDYDQQIEYTRLLLSRNVAGLIISPSGSSEPYYDRYAAAGVPVVYIDSYPVDRFDCNCVMIDNSSAARRLAEHMIAMYGSDILVLSTSEGSFEANSMHTSDIRCQAFLAAFASAGLEVRPGFTHVLNKSSFECGYRFMRRFLADNRPRAIVSASNNITYGAIAAIHDAGLTVPGDVAVACFDAVDPTGLVRPRITSMNQPTRQMGALAARLILDKIADTAGCPNQKIMVEPVFKIQESCGCKE